MAFIDQLDSAHSRTVLVSSSEYLAVVMGMVLDPWMMTQAR